MAERSLEQQQRDERERARRRFTWEPGDVVPSQCVYCRRFQQGACAAFPQGIPVSILSNRLDHTKAVVGDRGIRFAPKSDDAEAAQARIFDRGETPPINPR